MDSDKEAAYIRAINAAARVIPLCNVCCRDPKIVEADKVKYGYWHYSDYDGEEWLCNEHKHSNLLEKGPEEDLHMKEWIDAITALGM